MNQDKGANPINMASVAADLGLVELKSQVTPEMLTAGLAAWDGPAGEDCATEESYEAAILTAIYLAMLEHDPTIRVMREALRRAEEAIASLPEDALGMAQIAFGEPGVDVYPLRDELLSEIRSALGASGHD